MKVVFACAGTGGHVNPAIAIANIILKHNPGSEILFIGTKTGLENKLVSNAGFNIKHISTGKLLREISFENVKSLYRTYKGIGDSLKILKEFNPDIVIGTGGYICGPVMIASHRLKIPYILHESNAFPGISVKLLAKNASKVMISFKEAKERLKNRENVIYTGTPAKFNTEDYDKLDKEMCKIKLGLSDISKKIVLVTCGSQGAKKVNQVVMEMLEKSLSDKYYIVLITGEKNYEEIIYKIKDIEKSKKIDLSKYIKVEKFVYEMDKMYKAADICVVRGGAMTITELSICSKASIIIPLPTAAENHQYYNAKVLESKNAAKIIEQKDLTADVLENNILELLQNDNYIKYGENARKQVQTDVEEKIYKCINETLNKV